MSFRVARRLGIKLDIRVPVVPKGTGPEDGFSMTMSYTVHNSLESVFSQYESRQA